MTQRKRILVDFDGVLHSYTSGWKGARTIPDPPVPGALAWLCRSLETLDIAVLSSRSHVWGGRRAMKAWLRESAASFFAEEDATLKHWDSIGFDPGMDPWPDTCDDAAAHLARRIEWPRFKVPSHLTLDDRAVCFRGAFPEPAELLAFRTWQKP